MDESKKKKSALDTSPAPLYNEKG